MQKKKVEGKVIKSTVKISGRTVDSKKKAPTNPPTKKEITPVKKNKNGSANVKASTKTTNKPIEKKISNKNAPTKTSSKNESKGTSPVKAARKKYVPTLFGFPTINDKIKGQFSIPDWDGKLNDKAVSMIEKNLNKGLMVVLTTGEEEVVK